MNVLWFLMDFCQVSYRCGLLKVGKYGVAKYIHLNSVSLLDCKAIPNLSVSVLRRVDLNDVLDLNAYKDTDKHRYCHLGTLLFWAVLYTNRWT